MVNTLTELVILDRQTGIQLQRDALTAPASSAGATDGRSFYYGSITNWYRAVDVLGGLMEWELPAEGYLTAPVSYFEGVLYAASEGGVAYATQIGAKGQLLWTSNDQQSAPMHGAVTGAPLVDGRGLFVPCEDNRLYAYNRSTGAPLWPAVVCQGPLRDPVQASQDSLFVYALRDQFYAVDVATGSVRWTMPQGRRVLMVLKDAGGSRVYLCDADGNLLVADEILGRVQTVLPLGAQLLLGNTTAPAIYGATSDGHVVCVRPESAGRLMPAGT
jgi:outer membrane protein assembly factor BamB